MTENEAKTFVNHDTRAFLPILRDRIMHRSEELLQGKGTSESPGPVETDPTRATLVSSVCKANSEMHFPVIDIDHRRELFQVVRSASGNTHLFINVPMPWEKAERLLDVMVEVGLADAGYAAFCKKQKRMQVRMPGVPKVGRSS